MCIRDSQPEGPNTAEERPRTAQLMKPAPAIEATGASAAREGMKNSF